MKTYKERQTAAYGLAKILVDAEAIEVEKPQSVLTAEQTIEHVSKMLDILKARNVNRKNPMFIYLEGSLDYLNKFIVEELVKEAQKIILSNWNEFFPLVVHKEN